MRASWPSSTRAVSSTGCTSERFPLRSSFRYDGGQPSGGNDESLAACGCSACVVLVLAPARAAAERLISLEVALGDVSLNKVSFLIAADTGIYARNGLDVRQYITPGAARGRAQLGRHRACAIRQGRHRQRADRGRRREPDDVPRRQHANGIHRIALLTTEGVVRDTIITTQRHRASVEDLKGKRLGYSVPGAVTHVAALHFAKHMGWDPNKDVTLVGNAQFAQSARRKAAPTGSSASAMTVAMAPEMNLKLLIDLTPYKFPVGGSSIMAERSWLAANRDTAARFVKASIEVARADEEGQGRVQCRARQVVQHQGPGRRRNACTREIEEIPLKPYPTVEGIKATLEFYNSPEMRKYKAEDFYDSSVMTELDRSGFIDRLYR